MPREFWAIMGLLVACTSSISYYTKINEASSVNSVHFSPDSTLIVVGSGSNKHNIYSLSTLTPVYTYAATSACNSAKFSPNQRFIAFGMTNTSVVILNAADYSLNMTITSKFNPIGQIDFNSNSSKLLVCGKGGTFMGYEIWEITSGVKLSSDYAYTRTILSCTFSSADSFAIGDNSSQVYFYNPNYVLNATSIMSVFRPLVTGIAFSPNASIIAYAWASAVQRILIG